MGRIAILTDDPGWHGRQLRRVFAERGYDSSYVSLTQCRIDIEHDQLPIVMPGFDDALPDGVFVRGVPGGSVDEVIFYLDILHALKRLAIPVYNSGRAIERSVDKGMTSFLLHQAAIATPPTWVVRDRKQAIMIGQRELKRGHSLISKPLFGSQGEGLQRIENFEALLRQAGHRGLYYLQRFVDCGTEPHDWRVFVINGRAIAAMRRNGVGWLNNVAQGALCEPAALNKTMAQLAEAAVTTLKMHYAGVDIIRHQNGHYSVLEVNSIPAWKGLQRACDIDVAALLADDFLALQKKCCRETRKMAVIA